MALSTRRQFVQQTAFAAAFSGISITNKHVSNLLTFRCAPSGEPFER